MQPGQGSGRNGDYYLFRPSGVPGDASMFVDFANERAWRGLVAPLDFEDAFECVRASTGFAVDAAGVRHPFGLNVPRITDLGILIEPATTNRVTLASNANPAATTGVTLSGDAAATLTLVDDVAELELAGLAEICTSGKVYKLDNSAAVAATQATVTTNNSYSIGQYVVSFWVRGSGNGRIRNSAMVPSYSALPTHYERWSFQNAATAVSSSAARVQADVGAILYFILPQFEIGTEPTSPIITAGAIATRAADALTIDLPDGTHDLTFTFDNDSTQSVAGQSGEYAIPTNLNRRTIKSVKAVAA